MKAKHIKVPLPIDKPRYVAALLTYKDNNATASDGMIDMGWNTGIHMGIYRNVFRDRGRILFAKRKQTLRV